MVPYSVNFWQRKTLGNHWWFTKFYHLNSNNVSWYIYIYIYKETKQARICQSFPLPKICAIQYVFNTSYILWFTFLFDLERLVMMIVLKCLFIWGWYSLYVFVHLRLVFTVCNSLLFMGKIWRVKYWQMSLNWF